MAHKIPGEFVPCYVNLQFDVAIMRAGAMAELLYRRSLEHAKRTKRDGLIFVIELDTVARGIPGKAATHAETLVREGLWSPRDDGWQVRSFLKWNSSEAEKSAEAYKKRLGALRSNHKQGQHSEPHPECPDCQAVPK